MKKMLLSLNCLVLLFLLTACGIGKPPDVETIREGLPSELTLVTVEDPFDMTSDFVCQLDVNSVAIEKRQTNGKEDITYCKIELSCEYLLITRYVTLNYNYYDEGGWILDSWDNYREPEYKICKPPFDEKNAESKWSYSYDEVAVEAFEVVDDTTVQYTMQVRKDYTNASDTGKLVNRYCLRPLPDHLGYYWEETTDVSGISREWNVVGEWVGYEELGSGFVLGSKLKITGFSAETASAAGTFTFAYPDYSPLNFQNHQMSPTLDLKNAKITIKKEKIIFEWSRDAVEIGLDNISVNCLNGWGHKLNLPALKRA